MSHEEIRLFALRNCQPPNLAVPLGLGDLLLQFIAVSQGSHRFLFVNTLSLAYKFLFATRFVFTRIIARRCKCIVHYNALSFSVRGE